MKIKLILVILSFLWTNIAADKYQNVGTCSYYNYHTEGKSNNLTLICLENITNNNLLTYDSISTCLDQDLHRSSFDKSWIGTISIENCIRPIIPDNFFYIYTNIHSFNISNIGITSLEANFFDVANKLEQLFASYNEITEIPALLFAKAKNLIEIDFSHNKIEKVDAFTFSGDFNLKKLNLCSNQLTELGTKIFQDHSNLMQLDLCRNSIRKMDKETFDNLHKLWYLNLSHNKLVEIKSGTFSPLHRLQTLDLSNNELKALSADSFPPSLDELRLLLIANNQLRNLNDFMTSYSSYRIVGIDSNNFECSYLNHLVYLDTWRHLDPTSKLIECNSFTEETLSIEQSETTTIDFTTEDESKSEAGTEIENEMTTQEINFSDGPSTVITNSFDVEPSIDDSTESTETVKTYEPNETEKGEDIKEKVDPEKSKTKIIHEKYYEAGSFTHLLVTTWIIAICLIIIVLGLMWLILRNRLTDEDIFASVLYRQNDEEPIN